MTKIVTPFDQLSNEAFIRIHQFVPDVVPTSFATIYRGVADGTFPKPYRIGKSASAWNVGEIREYLRNLKRADEVEAGIQKSVSASVAARARAKARTTTP